MYKRLRNKIVRNKELFIVALLIIFGFIVRFYNYPYRFGLGDESVRDAAVAIIGASEIQLPLTGPFSSAGPFTFGPWYYYQLIFAQSVLKFDYAPWIYLGILSLLCVPLAYLIGKNLISKNFGLLLAFVVSVSPPLILDGLHLTNPSLANFFAFLSVYLLIRTLNTKTIWIIYFVLGISLGIAISLHYQMVGLLFLPIIASIFNYKKSLNYLVSVAGIFLTYIPMLLFDLNNHWFNLRNIFYFYTEGKNAIYVPNRWLFYLRDFWPSFIEDVVGLTPLIGSILMIVFLIFTARNILKNDISKKFLILNLVFLINFILLRYYWGERYFGYLNYLRPFVFIFISYAIYCLFQSVHKRNIKFILSVLIVLIFLFFNIPKIYEHIGSDLNSMIARADYNMLKSKFPGEKFIFYICPGEGNTQYSSKVHSLIFLLDRGELLGNKGRPISYNNSKCLPPGITSMPSFINTNNNLKESIKLVDLSSNSSASISSMGWRKHSLKLIHDSTVRWWFKEQP